MPVVKVWCLPPNQTEENLKKLYEEIVRTVIGIKKLGINKKSVTCLFPPDQMQYGLGDEIIIEIDGLFEKPERTNSVRQQLAQQVALCVKKLYKKAKVECFVRTFDPAQGFCSIENPPARLGRR